GDGAWRRARHAGRTGPSRGVDVTNGVPRFRRAERDDQPDSAAIRRRRADFVGQKNGVIRVFQSLTDTNPVTFADLSGRVHDFWDRGLLGLALPPNFPLSPYVYVLYAYDAPIGGTGPR